MIVEKTLRNSIEEDVPILVLQNMFNMEQNTQTNLKKNEKYIQDFKRKFCTIKRL